MGIFQAYATIFGSLDSWIQFPSFLLSSSPTPSPPSSTLLTKSTQLEGHDSDPDPILLNPAHALVGKWGRYRDTARAFADWMVRADGGQKVVGGFVVGGMVLYTRAPCREMGERECSAVDSSFQV